MARNGEADLKRIAIRADADAMIVTMARKAADEGDLVLFDQLMSRLPDVQARPLRGGELSTMDWWRVVITMLMIGGLLVIIAYAVANEENENAGQYVSLFSGLAGISIGWLFGSGSAAAVADAVRSTGQQP